jgi:adenosylcobinamide-phosphate synthase
MQPHPMTIALIAGVLLDLALGDPRWLPHPVRGIGLLVNTLERLLRRDSPAQRRSRTAASFRKETFPSLVKEGWPRHQLDVPKAPYIGAGGVVGSTTAYLLTNTTPSAPSEVASQHSIDGAATPPRLRRGIGSFGYERAAGCVLVCAVLSVVVAFVAFTLRLGGFLIAAYWIFTCLAIRSLHQESNKVIEALRAGDINRARTLVSQLVGRDTQQLSEKEVTRAVFETVAENMSDAIVAPLFYLAILGVPGMVAYKAVNTMDSMIAYKNDRYIRFGWAAARLDDVANYIPARITACLIVLSAALVRLHWRRAIHIVFRDARLQPSPNAGYPEAALAGALGVQLGGLNYYFGRPVEKPFLGDPLEDLEWKRFSQVRQLLYLVTIVSVIVVALWLL